jgi:hypothetical protein
VCVHVTKTKTHVEYKTREHTVTRTHTVAAAPTGEALSRNDEKPAYPEPEPCHSCGEAPASDYQSDYAPAPSAYGPVQPYTPQGDADHNNQAQPYDTPLALPTASQADAYGYGQ